MPMTKKGRDECKRSKPIFSFLAYTMENNQKMRKRCPALHLSLFCLSVSLLSSRSRLDTEERREDRKRKAEQATLSGWISASIGCNRRRERRRTREAVTKIAPANSVIFFLFAEVENCFPLFHGKQTKKNNSFFCFLSSFFVDYVLVSVLSKTKQNDRVFSILHIFRQRNNNRLLFLSFLFFCSANVVAVSFRTFLRTAS